MLCCWGFLGVGLFNNYYVRHTPVISKLLRNLLVELKFQTYRALFSVVTVGLVILAGKRKILPSGFKTRFFERTHNTNRITSNANLKRLVDLALSGRNIIRIRPFNIVMSRL